MKNKKTSLLYKIILSLIWLFYPRIEVEGVENLPDEAAVIVANHSQMNGPICCELYSPRQRYTWCAGEMMQLKEVPAYAYKDFWSEKPKYTRLFYKILSYVIAPLSVCLFNNARTIGVYRDKRIITTFKNSVKRLSEGADVVIFPEYNKKHNHIVYEFQEGFVDLAKIYHKRCGRELCFVPMYIAPKQRKMYIGAPVKYCAENDINEEKKRICTYLMNEITKIARALPEHTVVPYRNIPKRDYPTNKENSNEKTHC